MITYATFILAFSISDFGRRSFDLASGLGVAGLFAKEVSKFPSMLSESKVGAFKEPLRVSEKTGD